MITIHVKKQEFIDWLLQGDVSIQYQVWRDLLNVDKPRLRERMATEGWGHAFLSKRKIAGHWGDRFYQPKWISTHYTLQDLRNLYFPPAHQLVHESIEFVLEHNIALDGGIRLGPSSSVNSDVCVNGMFLNYASYFQTDENKLQPVLDSILNEIMPDGGFNCRTPRTGAKHSSLHTTLSVLEGLAEFQKAGYRYKHHEICRAKESAIEFILQHRLFLSSRTGQIIDPKFLKFVYPCRWRYDILRALDFFQFDAIKWDQRMQAAIDMLNIKRNKNGTWNANAAHAGQVHFTMEQAGKPGRWNTLRALRVLKHFDMF